MSCYGDTYQDRGMAKWGGMYHSEHTNAINMDKNYRHKRTKSLTKMCEFEISDVLSLAIIKNFQVPIQIDITDLDGRFSENKTGFIKCFSDFYVYINNQKVLFKNIRNIQITEFTKWNFKTLNQV